MLSSTNTRSAAVVADALPPCDDSAVKSYHARAASHGNQAFSFLHRSFVQGKLLTNGMRIHNTRF